MDGFVVIGEASADPMSTDRKRVRVRVRKDGFAIVADQSPRCAPGCFTGHHHGCRRPRQGVDCHAALANRRAGVREAHTLILNSPNLAHAKLLVQGLLARVDAECNHPQGVDVSTPSPSIVTVSDLRVALDPYNAMLRVRVTSPEVEQAIERVVKETLKDGSDIVSIETGYGST